MSYLMPQRRQGRGSSGPESLFEVNRRSRKSKSRRSSKAKRRVKFRHGGLRLVRFVLQSSSIYSPFFLARFGMRELCAWFSRHVRNLHSACLSHEREYCAGVCYGDTERAFEALLERLSSFFVVLLTCRFTLCLFIVESKSRVKHETNSQVLFSSFVLSCADKFTGRLFWGVFKHRNGEIPKCENKIKSRSSKLMSLSEAVRGSATHGRPPWFATVKRCNLTQKLCWVPFATKSPPRTSKRHRTSPVEITTRPSQAKEKGPHDTAYSLTVTHPRTNPGFEKRNRHTDD